jgi:hypothetical protein
MPSRSMIAGIAALLAACTGRGIDRTGAVPVRGTLEVRPVADGDPWLGTIAATAQGTLAAHDVEVTTETAYSDRLPPLQITKIRAGTKGTLTALVERAEPAPSGLRPGYEREREDRWSLLAVRVDEGMTLGADVLVTLAWGQTRGDQAPAAPEPEGVYLLLGPDDGPAFEQLTLAHDGRRLAILQGDEVLMAPTVNEPIGGGQILINPGTDGTAADLYQRLTGQPAPPHP